MGCLVNIVVNTAVLLIVSVMFTGFEFSGFGAALLAAVLLGIVNTIVRPVLLVLTLPVTVLTLGIFIFIINAAMLSLTSWVMGDAFVISGFGTAILAAVMMAILNAIVYGLILRPLSS